MYHQWLLLPLTMSQPVSVIRMCSRCGFTQVLEQAIAPPLYDWFTVEGGVIGVDCTQQPPVSTNDLGYTIPTGQ